MLKEAIEKITELAGPKTFKVGEKTFSDGILTEVTSFVDMPQERALTSLDAVVKLILNEAVQTYQAPYFVTIPDYKTVEVFTRAYADKRFLRNELYKANATDVPGWGECEKLGFEQASIALQTRFQESVDREYALMLLSQITCGGKVTYNDNGIATTVVTQKGVALQGTEAIRPLVKLKPYRTFQEVEQPESLFLIRIDERGISFTEADGGMWKLAARKTVKSYLESELAELVNSGDVVIAL